jgi:hypothetical protein
MAHHREAAAAAMASDEHYPANLRSRKAPLSMRLDQVVTLVGFVSPETSPASASPAPSPILDEGALAGPRPPIPVAGRLVKARVDLGFSSFSFS